MANRFEGYGTRPVTLVCALESINDNAMAIGGLASILADLKMDAEGLTPEHAEEYPTLAKIKAGLHDYPFLRAIEVLAEEIDFRFNQVCTHLDRLEREMKRNGYAPPATTATN